MAQIAMQETGFDPWVRRSQKAGDPASILVWRILWTEGLEGLQSVGSQNLGRD